MTGETDLHKLIATMEPELHTIDYVFSHIKTDDLSSLKDLKPIGTFMESEGMTAIVPLTIAQEHQILIESVFSCITLNVHSSLDAVGLTAAIATALGEQGISANVVAAYYHDHVFVNKNDAEKALNTLRLLSKNSADMTN